MLPIENKKLARQWSFITEIPLEDIIISIKDTDLISPRNMINWRLTLFSREDYLDWMPYCIRPKGGTLQIHYVNINHNSHIYNHNLILTIDIARIGTLDERLAGHLISTFSYEV